MGQTLTCRSQNPDIPRARPNGAAHGGTARGAGLGRIGCRQIGPPKKIPSLFPPKASKMTVWKVFQEHQQKTTYYVNCKQNENGVASAVYQRDQIRISSLVEKQGFVCFVTLILYKACSVFKTDPMLIQRKASTGFVPFLDMRWMTKV